MVKIQGLLGRWAFVAGVIIAIIAGLFTSGTVLGSGTSLALVIIGLIVGLLNITVKEVKPFLMSGLVLVIVAYTSHGVFDSIWPGLGNVFSALMLIIVPALIIVALKEVFSIVKK